jgi:hypothetical protein
MDSEMEAVSGWMVSVLFLQEARNKREINKTNFCMGTKVSIKRGQGFVFIIKKYDKD